MSEPLPQPWSLEDFLAWEARQPERHEFVDGVVRMMIGGSAAHTVIKDNVTAFLQARLRGTACRAYSEGLKVVSAAASLYPDVTVACTPVGPTDDRITEPVVIIEVLSRTTADHDRGAKWVAYRELASLQSYVLIAQHQRRVEVYSRAPEGWSLKLVQPPISGFNLPAIGVELPLDEIYQDSGC